jgi:uncharacterized protein YecE (DUF72 family)
MPEVRIGCSGFSYGHWRGVFYPDRLAQSKWFAYYCETFSTVELNVTFYRLPQEKTFLMWHRATPDDFVFALKGSRFITHVKRLIDPEESLRLFFERATALREKLAVVLWQFPPAFKVDTGRLKKFLRALRRYPARYTLEFRHPSWMTDEVIDLAARDRVSLCMAEWPEFLDNLPVTSDFVYMRRHGLGGDYATDYSAEALRKDARRIQGYMDAGKDVYLYFNNDAHGYAPKNARELMAMLR